MTKDGLLPPLRHVFLSLILFRVFLPLLATGIGAVAGMSYLGLKFLQNQQQQVVQSLSRIVDHHLDHGGRILDAVARMAEASGEKNLQVFMKSTWEAYGYFDTLYQLDENDNIVLIMPPEPNYAGLDMSNLPDFKNVSNKNYSISRPFISVRTGAPTVYLVRKLAKGGSVVGELNLGVFQKEIDRISSGPGKDFVFIMDQSGTLLAHPDAAQVKQQTNLSNLGIFHSMLTGISEDFYAYGQEKVLGSATRVEKTGWLIVNQLPLSVFMVSYAWIFALIFSASLAIWITLAWNLRKRIQRHVIAPLEQLSRSANSLAMGDFSQVNTLTTLPSSFAELRKLASDFHAMSSILHARETDQQNAHDELEKRVEKRTEELFVINNNLQATTARLQQSNQELHSEIAERRRAQALLAQKVEEIELAHTELKNAQSQMLQQEKMASIGQLAAGVAHEINNPIGFINSNLGTLRNYVTELLDVVDAYAGCHSCPPQDMPVLLGRIQVMKQNIDFTFLREDIRKLIDESMDGATRIKRIVQDLRDFSRIGSSEWIWTDLHAGLDSTLNVLGSEIKDKAVVVCEYGTLPQVECIPAQINQVFMNLLLNATQAITGQGRITIRSGSDADEAWISITDNGKGIPAEAIARIFDPFFTTRPVGAGIGLGLSVAHGIVKNHGGKIEVMSQAGQGSTFIIRLPIRHLHTT